MAKKKRGRTPGSVTKLGEIDDDVRTRIEARLRTYKPREGKVDLSHCGLTATHADWLMVRLQRLTNLKSLHIPGNQIGEAGATAIAQRLTKLTALDISDNSIGEAGATAIAQRLTKLTALGIGRNSIGDAGATTIAQHLSKLTILDINNNSICEAGATAIAQHLSKLTNLHISFNQIGDAGASAIAQRLTKLTALDIARNSISEAGATAIAQCLIKLTVLGIVRNSIGEAGATAIAQCLTKLTALGIGNNSIGEAGATAIAQRLTKLTALGIGNNSIGESGATAIAQCLTKLTTLHIGLNQIGEAGATEIAQRLTKLTALDISNNSIGEAGATVIAQRLTKLTALNINYNSIGEAGATAIAQRLTKLTALDIGDNQIGDAGLLIRCLRRWCLAGLKWIDVRRNRLCWPGTNDAIAEEVLSISNPKDLLNRLNELSDPANRTRVHIARIVMTGPTTHGKTHLARWLVAHTEEEKSLLRQQLDRGPDGNGTWGVDRFQTTLTVAEHQQQNLPNIQLRVFDCGGHPQQLQSHQNLYFSTWNRTVFALCVRADRDFSESTGEYHLGLIADLKANQLSIHRGKDVTTQALLAERQRPGPPDDPDREKIHVVMVRTHADVADAQSSRLRFPSSQQLIQDHPLVDGVEVKAWDALRGHDLDEIKQVIGAQLSKLPALRAAMATYVAQVGKTVEGLFASDDGAFKSPYKKSMSLGDFRQLCRSLEVHDRSKQDHALTMLNALGVLVAPDCDSERFTDDLTILNPRFVQDFIYVRLLNMKQRPVDGLVPVERFNELLGARMDSDDRAFAALESMVTHNLIGFKVRNRADDTEAWLIPDLLEMNNDWDRWTDVSWAAHLDVPHFFNESIYFRFLRDQKNAIDWLLTGRMPCRNVHRNGCVLRNVDMRARIRIDVTKKAKTVVVEVVGPSELARRWGTRLMGIFEEATGCNSIEEEIAEGHIRIRHADHELREEIVRLIKRSKDTGIRGSEIAALIRAAVEKDPSLQSKHDGFSRDMTAKTVLRRCKEIAKDDGRIWLRSGNTNTQRWFHRDVPAQ